MDALSKVENTKPETDQTVGQTLYQPILAGNRIGQILVNHSQ